MYSTAGIFFGEAVLDKRASGAENFTLRAARRSCSDDAAEAMAPSVEVMAIGSTPATYSARPCVSSRIGTRRKMRNKRSFLVSSATYVDLYASDSFQTEEMQEKRSGGRGGGEGKVLHEPTNEAVRWVVYLCVGERKRRMGETEKSDIQRQ